MQAALGLAARQEFAHRQVRQSFARFFTYAEPNKPYAYGRHTIATLRLMDSVLASMEAGQSRYVRIEMPFRHGKSDIISRRALPYFLLRHPSWEIILASYGYDLATELADDARRCFREWAPIFGVDTAEMRDRVASWRTTAGGAMFASGLGGTITGRGAHVLGIDDYLRNRADAESDVITDRLWDSFRSDLMTRLAPVHAVIIMANRWGLKDLAARIDAANDPTNSQYDPRFPVFERHIFPAENADGTYLFPERFSHEWYDSVKAMLGSYAWQAQAMQNPQPRAGHMFDSAKCQVVDDVVAAAGPGAAWRWGVDLASTVAEHGGDPDYTVATLEAFDKAGRKLYVRDVFKTRLAALERDAALETRIIASGVTRVVVESVAGYKDAFQYIRERLRGRATVTPCTPTRDKVARAIYLEPIFEAGNVYIQRGNWNVEWKRAVAGFPGLPHDDEVDSMVIGIYRELAGGGTMGMAA